MKVLHVSYLDNSGGAHIAARRICEAQIRSGIDASMLVSSKGSSKSFVFDAGFKRKLYNMFCNMFGQKLCRFQKNPTNVIQHSLNIFPSRLAHHINKSDCDVVNLHWINAEFVQIEDLSKITKPIVWTLHDMWPFCGSEHYDDLEHPERYIEGYNKSNRPGNHTGIDWDRYTFNRKKKSYPFNMKIVSPSAWMKRCASESLLLKENEHHVVPNTLDSGIFKPLPTLHCREQLNLPIDKKLILFGAFNSKDDPRKGFRFIRKVIDELNTSSVAENIEFVIFGSESKEAVHYGKIKANYIGKYSDELALAAIYNAVDVFVAPSMQDNLPNTILEAQACGTPTVAFDIGGISDLVVDDVTGYLAEPFKSSQLAELLIKSLSSELSVKCRINFIEKYSESVISEKYLNVYKTKSN